jgi:hypothetical protein
VLTTAVIAAAATTRCYYYRYYYYRYYYCSNDDDRRRGNGRGMGGGGMMFNPSGFFGPSPFDFFYYRYLTILRYVHPTNTNAVYTIAHNLRCTHMCMMLPWYLA